MTSYNDHLMQLDHETDAQTDEVVEEHMSAPWRVILYNDNIHTFDEVITSAYKGNRVHALKS